MLFQIIHFLLGFLEMHRTKLGKHSIASLPFKEGLVNLLHKCMSNPAELSAAACALKISKYLSAVLYLNPDLLPR